MDELSFSIVGQEIKNEQERILLNSSKSLLVFNFKLYAVPRMSFSAQQHKHILTHTHMNVHLQKLKTKKFTKKSSPVNLLWLNTCIINFTFPQGKKIFYSNLKLPYTFSHFYFYSCSGYIMGYAFLKGFPHKQGIV